METSGEPDTTSQTGRQMNCYKGRQINWRHPESRTQARLGHKWTALRGDKWSGDIRRAQHHQPDWQTNGWLQGETNELETSGEPDTTSQIGKQMNCYEKRQMNWRHRELDTTSQTGRQSRCYKGRQMNWRHAESRTPQAKLGDKSVAIRGDKWIGDIQRAGHHKPDWETNELLQGEANELETSGEPDTTSQTGRQMNCCKGRL